MSLHPPPSPRRKSALGARLLMAAARCYARAYHRLDVLQPCPLPRTGPAILVCNHTSSLDPVLIQSLSNRLIRWMMAREYFDLKPLRWIFNEVGVILVQRGGSDMPATRAAIAALRAGEILGVFPEGKIEPFDQLLPFQRGVGLLALRTRAPVYPAYLDGTQRGRNMLQPIVFPMHASLSFAPPLDLSDLACSPDSIDHATQRILTAVDKLGKICRSARR